MAKKKPNILSGSAYHGMDSFDDETCPNCSGPLKPEKVNLEEFEAGKLFHMEQVPGYLCEACGEIWVPEPILKEFEKMIEITHERRKEQKKSKSRKKS